MVVRRASFVGWIAGCSKKTKLDREKNSGHYGDLTTVIPYEKIVMNCSKVTKRLATAEKKE